MNKSTKSLTINERFSELRFKLKLTKDALGKVAGVSGTAIANIESGATKSPSAETIVAISTGLGISSAWLLTGEGPMLTADATPQKSSSYTSTQALHLLPSEVVSPDGMTNARVDRDYTLRELPYLPRGARANFAETYPDDTHKYKWENHDTLGVINVPPTKEYENAIVVDVDGDSMEPTIKSGAKVVVTPVQQADWQYMNSGIYCFIYNSTFVIKRVKDNTLMENGILRLYSDNPNGGSFPIKGDEIRAVWRVRFAVYVPLY